MLKSIKTCTTQIKDELVELFLFNTPFNIRHGKPVVLAKASVPCWGYSKSSAKADGGVHTVNALSFTLQCRPETTPLVGILEGKAPSFWEF